MTAAVRNYVAVPFFDRVPPRVMDLVLTTFDNIVERALSKREAYCFFANSVKKRQFEGPTFEDFSDWYERVKNGLIDRPHPSEAIMSKKTFFDDVPTRINDLVLYAFDAVTERSAQSPREAYNHFINTLKPIDDVTRPTFDEYVEWRERVKNGLIERQDPLQVIPSAREARMRYEDQVSVSTTPNPAANPYNPREKGTEERLVRAVENISPEAAEQLFDCYVRTSTSEITPPSIPPIIERDGQRIACEVTQIAERELRIEQARAIVKAAHELFEVKRKAGYSPDAIIVEDTIVAEALRDLIEAEDNGTVMDADMHMTTGNKLADLLLAESDEDIDAKLVDCLTMDMQPELCHILSRPGALKSR